MNILESLKVFGIPSKNENAFLASMLLGEPSVLIGAPGSSKTELANMIGSALREHSRKESPDDSSNQFSYQVYDASKINFEDLIGYPDIEKFKNGKVSFIETPITIWNKDLVVFDELNRCQKERQSNLFEILRSRKCNGIPTNNKFIFSTMNPYGDTGTEEMSDALVDRHLFYIYFQKFSQMGEKDKKAILDRIGTTEGIGLRYWSDNTYNLDTSDDQVNEYLADIGGKLSECLKNAFTIYNELQEDIGEKIKTLILMASQNLLSQFREESFATEIDISGRRASMIYRAILAYRAVEQSKASIFGTPAASLKDAICDAFIMSIPIGIAGKVDKDAFNKVHHFLDSLLRNSWDSIINQDSTVDQIYSLYNDTNPFTKLEILINSDIDELTKKDAWSRLYSQNQSQNLVYLIYALKEATNLVPDHLIVDTTYASYTRLTSEMNPYLSKHSNTLEEIRDSLKDDNLLSVAFECSLEYYNKNTNSSIEAYANIEQINSFIESISSKLSNDPDPLVASGSDIQEPQTSSSS